MTLKAEIVSNYIKNLEAQGLERKLDELVNRDPKTAWVLIQEIAWRLPAHKITYTNLTWPIEKILRLHGKEMLADVGAAATDNNIISCCLGFIFRFNSKKPADLRINGDVIQNLTPVSMWLEGPDKEPVVSPRVTQQPTELEKIVSGWLTYHETFWAIQMLDDAINNDPATGLELTFALINEAPTEPIILATIAAGPLENLLRDRCNFVIDRIEEYAQSSLKLRTALSHVWLRRSAEAFPRWQGMMEKYGFPARPIGE